ncbi:hypothetical protein [Pantoea septica]|uniref:hypothetical protein n=1 Tax=Pantoea septica TaxID=472695 RepID=UPI0028978CC4|nr:hypothetical protein [Pantoea septica]
MKLIAANAATLSLADGSKFKIEPGIHDDKDFPEAVKKHWAFSSYVKPIDDSETEQGDSDSSAQIGRLQAEVASLKKTVSEQEDLVESLTGQIEGREATIGELQGKVDDLTAQLVAQNQSDTGQSNDAPVSEVNDSDGGKNAKKQQASK